MVYYLLTLGLIFSVFYFNSLELGGNVSLFHHHAIYAIAMWMCFDDGESKASGLRRRQEPGVFDKTKGEWRRGRVDGPPQHIACKEHKNHNCRSKGQIFALGSIPNIHEGVHFEIL